MNWTKLMLPDKSYRLPTSKQNQYPTYLVPYSSSIFQFGWQD